MSEDFRREAEEHWKFIEKLLTPRLVIREGDREISCFEKSVVHYLYVESMVHGYKHGRHGLK